MTTRDQRPRVPPEPGRPRDPTEALSIDVAAGADEDKAESLAMGTAEAKRSATALASPNARAKPLSRPPPTERLVDDPEQKLGNMLGAYRLLELLGKGGMGYVYRAEHVKLGREVALKLLRADYARRRDAVLRFSQEAKTVNRVRHRNIVDVTDIVELEDGTTFIIMEFLRGTSLGKWARSGIDLPRALAVLVQICDGLGAAHAIGVIHRDLKPDNVMVVPTSDGADLVKILDFGVAKLLNRDDEDVGFQTAAGSVIGTPAYMSPEQAGGMAIDHRSDIYSLGAIMYELFCGQPMFRGRSFGEYVRKHLTEIPIAPRQTSGGAQVDPRLEALILQCLSKDPNDRFGHILELRDGLLHIMGGTGDTVPPGYPAVGLKLPTTQLPPHMLQLPVPQMVTTVPTPYPQHHSTVQSQQHAALPAAAQGTYPPTEAPSATPWWVWFAGGALAVALGIGGAIWYANQSDPPPVAPATPPPATTLTAAATPPPTTAPIEAPAPQQVELKFDSLPKGSVYAEGHSAELCRTPCTYAVNLSDGGPADRRTFVIRADGYRDMSIVVDLAGTQREFNVTLDQLMPETNPPATEPEHAVATDKPRHPAHATATKSHNTSKSTETKHRDKPEEDTAEDETPAKPAEGKDKPVETKKPDKPVEVKPPDKTIDPSDTLDPFHRKKK